MTIILHDGIPCGQHEAECFVDYTDGTGEFKRMTLADYPDEDRRDALRARRVQAGLSIRDAAMRLGISVVDYSGIEWGRRVPEDWEAMLAVLFDVPGNTRKAMPNPTAEMLAGDPLFDAIWSVIKHWDVNVPEYYHGYCGANGSHVCLIYEAVQRAINRHVEQEERDAIGTH